MNGFMNPIFQPVDNNIVVKERRTFQISKPNFNQCLELPKEYERIFSSMSDTSQTLNDSLLLPFDNYNSEQALQQQNKKCLQINNSAQQQKNQRQFFQLDKNHLQQIIQILTSKYKSQQQPKEEQIINQIYQSKNIKNSSKTKKTQINKMTYQIKNDLPQKHQILSNQNENDQKSFKQRSSTNHSPRAEISLITSCPYSAQNLDVNSNQKLNDINTIYQLQRRTKSQYNPKQIIKNQIDEINQKINQLKILIFKTIKNCPFQQSIQQQINKIIQQNENSNLLQRELVNLKDFTNSKSFKEQKYYIYFNIQKILSLTKEKQKKLQLIMIFNKEGYSNDNLQSPKNNCILSRQTTSDNNTEEISDDKKKLFSLIVNRKLQLPINHPSKNILLCDLYEKVQQLGIQQSDWQQFIINEVKF
ncbi:unnamed protein product [Paramecium sonneborni]|uniref:Uncharacterized protein n=1 Tax=Paramecium sonneborni TaxID=65129 RepID=A0A8S1MAK3_9CILI|nr:unnamed protein product [Paramecium sonneborni]